MLKIDLEDLRSKGGDKVLGECTVVLLKTAGELRGVAEAVEEATKNLVRPFLCLPPLATFAFLLIFGDSFFRDLEVHDLEEEAAPSYEAVLRLLVLAQLEDDAGGVRLEDEVKESRHFVAGGGGRVGEGRGCKAHECREEFLHKFREDFVVLAEPETVMSFL